MRDLRKVLPQWADGEFLRLANGRLHLLVPNSTSRPQSALVAPHVWSGPLPEGSFYRYSDDLYIASPAFSFLLLARICTFAQLVAYGCELCGRYAFDHRDERGFRTRSIPLETIEHIASFLNEASAIGAPNVTNAKRALSYVAENAESPMETTAYVLLHPPYRYGGYGIDDLRLNCEIPLTTTARAIAKRRSCRADLFHEQARIDLEFQGKRDHAGPGALDKDRRRTNALTEMGYEVIELTSEQMRDRQAFEALALHLAHRAAKRIAPQYQGALPARMELRRQLFEWNAASGHPRQR